MKEKLRNSGVDILGDVPDKCRAAEIIDVVNNHQFALTKREGKWELIESAERKRVEEALKESEARYRLLFEHMINGFALHKIVIDDKGKPVDYIFLEANSAFERLTGLMRINIVGKRVTEVLPGIENDPADWIGTYGMVALTGKDARFEQYAGALDKWFSISAHSPSSDYFVTVFEDITERKKAEEALRRAHDELEKRVAERTAELAETVNHLQEEVIARELTEEELRESEKRISRLNRLYSVLSKVNEAIVRIHDPEELYERVCRITVEDGLFAMAWIGITDPESRSVIPAVSYGDSGGYLDGIRICAADVPEGRGPTGKAAFEGHYSICGDIEHDPRMLPWRDKALRHGFRSSAAFPLHAGGAIIGAFTIYGGSPQVFTGEEINLLSSMAEDISFALDNLNREARRREAERALQAETAERLRTMEELREKDRMLLQQSRQAAMGEMIGNIAHQWRQPLNTLGLTIQEVLMMYELGEFSREYLEARVNTAKEIIFHMSQTIDDFRNFFRPDKEKVPFKVNRVVAKTLSLIEGSFNSLQIRIEVDATGDPVINGYPNEYAQVLLNILINARDALLERRIDNPKVVILMSEENDKAVVTVTDNAGGIHEDIMYKIFDPYFTTKGPDKGTGVGLFMSKTIIEKNMNGALIARNTGEGAEFRIEV
ncbi:MAG: multi-sensor signal transduction histidine [Geobacteraceae bacterium]|nr:MAG: multi-sensor signal transduction histidine [Geobacteraceae bacterium]